MADDPDVPSLADLDPSTYTPPPQPKTRLQPPRRIGPAFTKMDYESTPKSFENVFNNVNSSPELQNIFNNMSPEQQSKILAKMQGKTK